MQPHPMAATNIERHTAPSSDPSPHGRDYYHKIALSLNNFHQDCDNPRAQVHTN